MDLRGGSVQSNQNGYKDWLEKRLLANFAHSLSGNGMPNNRGELSWLDLTYHGI
jgi:hypothetical protein